MSFQHSIQRIMSGQATGILPSLGRSALALIEPMYRFEVGRRNRRFDRDPSLRRGLPRPVISVGNLTTGGTGKTPVIRWLAAALRDRGLCVGILARGYKAKPGELGDEQRMLLAMLDESRARGTPAPHSPSDAASVPRPQVVIECDADRYAAGMRALARVPTIDVFLLDDAFQHRRLHRDLDIVLLHAPEPFGYGHVLPRGLLREPMEGLKRAGIVILTGSDMVSAPSLEATTAEVRRYNADGPIVLERHKPTGLRTPTSPSHAPADVPLEALGDKAVMCFSGLGSPGGFESLVRSLAGRYVGERRFRDHHLYTAADLRGLRAAAASAGANVLVTTEKDWVKLADLPDTRAAGAPIRRLDIEAKFDGDGADVLLSAVGRALPAGGSHRTQ